MSKPEIFNKKSAEYQLKQLNLGIEKYLKEALWGILFNKHEIQSYVGLPLDNELLKHHLCQFQRAKKDTLKSELNKEEWDLLCPLTGVPVPEKWTAKLIITVIINVLSIPPPLGGWNQTVPQTEDISLGATILASNTFLKRLKNSAFDSFDFQNWTLLRNILIQLKYSNMKKFDELFKSNVQEFNPTTHIIQDHMLKSELISTKDFLATNGRSENDGALIRTMLSNEATHTGSIHYPRVTDTQFQPQHQQKQPLGSLCNKKEPVESCENDNENYSFCEDAIDSKQAATRVLLPSENEENYEKAFYNKEKDILLQEKKNEQDNINLKENSKYLSQNIEQKEQIESSEVNQPTVEKPKTDVKLESTVKERAQSFAESTRRLTKTMKQLEMETVNHDENDDEGDILDEVYQIIADMLTRVEWEKLLNSLQLSFKEKFVIFLSTRSTEVLKSRNLSWSGIRNRLQDLNRTDVLKVIRTKTCISAELQAALHDHKESLRQNFMSKRFVKPFLGETGEKELDDKTLGDAFIELAIIKGKDVDEKFLNSNRDYHLQQMLLEKRLVALDQLVLEEDRFVMISGIPGIGKSTLVKKLILEWERGTLLSGQHGHHGQAPEIKLLFPILCRELNTMRFDEHDVTPIGVLRRLFPDFFCRWKLVKDISAHVMFLVDGVDELRGIEDIQSSSATMMSPPAHLLYQLMNPDFMVSHKSIFVGRPRIMRMIRSFFTLNFQCDIKKVEVCGFSDASVERYIMKQFNSSSSSHQNNMSNVNGDGDDKDCDFKQFINISSNKEEDDVCQRKTTCGKGKDILFKIRSSPITDGLSRIPFHAWVLTSIFKDNPFIESPSTATELLLYSFLVFIRRQKEKQSDDGADASRSAKQWTLKMVAEDEEVIQLILSVAKYSYETLQRREIIFEASEDEQDMLYAIEKIGLVVKSTKRESGVTIYQFQHLTFQELFAAIHIQRMAHIDPKLATSAALRACLTIVCGLEGISNDAKTSKPILQGMLRRLSRRTEDTVDRATTTRVLSVLQASWMKHWAIDPSQAQVIIDISDLFIEAFFESQCTVFPQHLALEDDTTLVFTKEKQASPLTKYPLYRLCNFIHTFISLHPTVNVKFFPLYSLSFGIHKLEEIMRRCQSLYLNTKSLVHEETIRLLTFVYEDLYRLKHFKELIINFEFSTLDRFLIEALASIFRFTTLECLHLRSIEISDKPRLRWPRMLALLQQSIKQNCSLKRLTLHKCSLTDELLIDIAPVFQHLTHIDISYNGLSQVSLNRILCCRSKAVIDMKCLNFSWNQFNQQSTTDLRQITPCNDANEESGYQKSFPLVKVLDISQCQSSSLNILEDVLVSNIIKTVKHLRVDIFTHVGQFLDVLSNLREEASKEKEEQNTKMNLQSIHIVGLDGQDERYIDSYREMRDRFRRFEIEVKLLDGETADFLLIPDWFEISFDAS